MKVLGLIGIILTLIGAILIAIIGGMVFCPGFVVLNIFSGISYLILGIGLVVLMVFFLIERVIKKG